MSILVALFCLLALAAWLLARGDPAPPRSTRPRLESLEGRDAPTTLAIDLISVGSAPLAQASQVMSQSPYAELEWTGSVGSINDIPGALASGAIPWQGSTTMLAVVGGPDQAGQHTDYRQVLRGPGGGAVVEAVSPAGVSPAGLGWEIAQTANGNIYRDAGSSLSNIPQGPDNIALIDHTFSNAGTPGGLFESLTPQQELFLLFLFYEWEIGRNGA